MHHRVTVLGLCVSESVCLCLSVTTLVATYLVYTSKASRYTVSCRFLKICIVWTSMKTFSSGDMAPFASHNDWRLSSFSTKNTPMIITNGTVYEPLARSDDVDYLK